MLVDNISQHTGLLPGNGLDVLFVTAETDVAVDVVGVLMRGLLGGGLGFCCEEFARRESDALYGDAAFSGLKKVVFQVYFLSC